MSIGFRLGYQTVAAAINDLAVREFQIQIDAISALGDKGIWIPGVAGHIFVISRYSQVVRVVTGTVTTAPAIDVGTNSPTFNNVLANSVPQTAGAINAGAGSYNSNNIVGASAAVPGANIHLALHTAAVGASVLRLTHIAYGYYTPVP